MGKRKKSNYKLTNKPFVYSKRTLQSLLKIWNSRSFESKVKYKPFNQRVGECKLGAIAYVLNLCSVLHTE